MVIPGGGHYLDNESLEQKGFAREIRSVSVKGIDLIPTETQEAIVSQVKDSPPAPKNIQSKESIALSDKKLKPDESSLARASQKLQINPIMNKALDNDTFRRTYGILDLSWEENVENSSTHTITEEEYRNLINTTNNQKRFTSDKIPSVLDAWETFFDMPKGKYFFIDHPRYLSSPLWTSDMKWVIVEFDKDINFLDDFTVQKGGDWIELTSYLQLPNVLTRNKINQITYEPLRIAANKLLDYVNIMSGHRDRIKNSFGKDEHFSTIEKALLRFPGSNDNARTFAVPNPQWLLKQWLRDWSSWNDSQVYPNITHDSFYPFEIHDNIKWRSIDKLRVNVLTRVHNEKVFKMWLFFNEPSLKDQSVYEYYSFNDYKKITSVQSKLWGPNFLKNIMTWYWYMYKPGYSLEPIEYVSRTNRALSSIRKWWPEIKKNPQLGRWNLLDIYRHYNLFNWRHQMFGEDFYLDMVPFISGWLTGTSREGYSYWWTYASWFLGSKQDTQPYSERWQYINKIHSVIYNPLAWKAQKQYSTYISKTKI